ncbi:MAG: polysaccharide deacetylase family protein [Bacteroidota bacterium]
MRLWPKRIWHRPRAEKVLYLTFDDGPTPEITEFVLDELQRFDAKATFFWLGKNVRTAPEIVHRAVREGHTLGNHTENHLNGWKTETEAYMADVAMAQRSFEEVTGHGPQLFRPPYGKAGRKKAKRLLQDYELVMWDVMSGDFHAGFDAERVLRNVLDKARPGSVVVFHDSVKCGEKMMYALPRVLKHFSERGFSFRGL